MASQEAIRRSPRERSCVLRPACCVRVPITPAAHCRLHVVKRTELPAIVAAWAAAIAIVQPRGNFPMLDDWDFALATWRFAETGHFHFTQFTVVSLRAMVLWGAAWTRLFGQSFEVLRASTLVLSLLTLLVVNRTLARMGVAAFPRVVATLALLVHPVFLWASC